MFLFFFSHLSQSSVSPALQCVFSGKIKKQNKIKESSGGGEAVLVAVVFESFKKKVFLGENISTERSLGILYFFLKQHQNVGKNMKEKCFKRKKKGLLHPRKLLRKRTGFPCMMRRISWRCVFLFFRHNSFISPPFL